MSLIRQFQPQLAVMSKQALAFQQAIAKLPDPNEDPAGYRKALHALNEKFSDFLRLQTQVQLVELSQQDPDEFMRVMPKIIDSFMPKLKSIEAKVDATVDNRIYVETAYRHEIPVDALKRAGVVIDSEAEPGVRETPPVEPQSPGRPGDSHPAPSVPTPPAPTLSQATRRALPSRVTGTVPPLGSGALGVALALTDAEVLS